jgi:predicted CopG family antitoxin
MAIELTEATEIHKNAMKQKTLMVDEQVGQWLKENRGAGSISDLIQELIDYKEGSKKTEKSDIANQDIQIMTVEAENARVGAEKARVEAKRAGVDAKKARTDLEAIEARDKTLEHESKKT